jgi:hypothetical protein
VEIPHSQCKFSHRDTELAYTDNVQGDKAELEHAFPALLKDVSPVLSSSLEPLALPPGYQPYQLCSTYKINNHINAIIKNLNGLPVDKFIHSVVDFKWPVDIATGIYRQWLWSLSNMTKTYT